MNNPHHTKTSLHSLLAAAWLFTCTALYGCGPEQGVFVIPTPDSKPASGTTEPGTGTEGKDPATGGNNATRWLGIGVTQKDIDDFRALVLE